MRTMIMSGMLASLFFCGGLMAEEMKTKSASNWVTIRDKEEGVQADFPHQPLEMEIDLPFQNTPAKGKVHFYSAPTNTGVFVLTTLTSSGITAEWLEKENLKQFFETILVPHFFYHPKIFQDHQVFTYQSQSVQNHKGASFQISYEDRGTLRRAEGIAFVRGHTLYTYFYLASKKDFDTHLLERFLKSVH